MPGSNQKIGNWDYDIAFTYLYQYGDPALGVGRNYVSSQIAKGQQFNNVEGYSNPEVDKLFAEGAVATTDSKRKEIYEKVQKILVEDVPVAWHAGNAVPDHHALQDQEPDHDRLSASMTASAMRGLTSKRSAGNPIIMSRSPDYFAIRTCMDF